MAASAPGPARRRIARGARLGVCTGAIGGLVDAVTAVGLARASPSVRIELALGCAVVGVLTGLLLGVLLTAAWTVLEALGRRLQGAVPRLPAPIATNVPLALALGALFAQDGAALFSGHGVSRTAFATVGRRVLPFAGALLGVVGLRGGLAACARLRRGRRSVRIASLIVGLGIAGLLLHAERLPQLDPYSALRRDCDLSAFLVVSSGLALFRPSIVVPGRLHTLPLRLAAAVSLSLLILSLPFLFPSSAARLALATRGYVASPEVHGIRHIVDLDRDGYSPLLGGGDCDDLDPRVHPFQRDPPGDGVDQDCDGVDGWGPELAAPEPPLAPPDARLRDLGRGKNVLVVLVDALRADRVTRTGASAFPRLSELSRQSISFAHALSPASRTPLSLPVTLDGGRGGPGKRLFHAFHASGADVGFVSTDVVIDELRLAERLDGEVSLVGVPTDGDRSGWGGGIHVFTGHPITEAALRWIDGRSSRHSPGQHPSWLLWVHYFSAHQWDSIDSVRSVPELPRRYDAALADDDRATGELMDGLAARGLTESTIVVLLADHGESLGDRGWRTHGSYVYPELVHVPFDVRIPGAAPSTIPTYVPTAALAPTLFDLTGIPAPDDMAADGDNASLVPLMAEGARPPDGAPRAIAMADSSQSALALGRRMVRFTPAENATELVSLDELDEPHPEDLLAREPDTGRRLSRMLVTRLSPP